MGNVLSKVKSMRIKADLPLIILIFFLLFAPPIIPDINTALIATIIVAFVLIIKYRTRLLSVAKKSGILKFLIYMLIFFCYLAIITVVNYISGERVQLMHYITLWYRFFLIVPILLIDCLYINIKCDELNYTLYDLVMQFVYAAMLQFLLVLISLLVPTVKEFFVDVMFKNTGDYYLGIPWVMERRGFGFSNSFVDSFGFGMGIIAALPLFFIKKNRLKIAYFIPCLLFISLVNVRTGLIMAAIGLVLALPVLFKTFVQTKLKMIAVVLTTLVLLITLVGVVQYRNPKTVSWILGDIISFVDTGDQKTDNAPSTNDTTEQPTNSEPTPPDENAWYVPELENDAQTTTAETLFSEDFWNLPLGKALIFGTGHTIYNAEGYPHSDVGYVNDLWMGGIIGALLLYLAFISLFYTAFKKNKTLSARCLVIFFAVSMLVFQVKANAIMFNAGINTILPITFFICFYNAGKEE